MVRINFDKMKETLIEISVDLMKKPDINDIGAYKD